MLIPLYNTCSFISIWYLFCFMKQGLLLHGWDEVQSWIDGEQDSWWPARFHLDIYHRTILRVLDKSFVINQVWTLISMSCISRDNVIHMSLGQTSCSSFMNKVYSHVGYKWITLVIEIWSIYKTPECQVMSSFEWWRCYE